MDSNEIPIDTDELARNLAEAEMPNEIYAWMGFQNNGSWDNKPCPCDSHASVKYVRADLTRAQPLPADREKVAKFMLDHGFATGHGDTIDDLLSELSWQIKERRPVTANREKVLDDVDAIDKELKDLQAETMITTKGHLSVWAIRDDKIEFARQKVRSRCEKIKAALMQGGKMEPVTSSHGLNLDHLYSNTCNCEGDNAPCTGCSYDEGWNNCIITLEEKRLLSCLPVDTQIEVDCLKLAEFCLKRAKTEDVLEPADHVYQLAKEVFKKHHGYNYGTKRP